MPKNRSTPRKHRGLDEVAVLMEEFHGSGMTVAEFAGRIGVSTPTVYHWKRRLRECGALPPSRSGPVPRPMVRIIPAPGPGLPFPSPPGDAGISIVLPGGFVCRVEPDFHGETLRRVAEILGR